MYRKGAIDTRATKGIALLALNPIDGLYLSSATFKQYEHSMQHGTGRKGSKRALKNLMNKCKVGNTIGYWLTPEDRTPALEQAKHDTYNTMDQYISHFGLEEKTIGFCTPKLVVGTKKSGGM